MRLTHAYGFDIGTSTVKLFDAESGAINKEYNLIAIYKNNSVFSIGNDAYEAEGKAPREIVIKAPMSNGRINDVDLMEVIVHNLLDSCSGRPGWNPTLFFAVPPDLTQIERRAYKTIGHRGNLRRSKVCFVEKPIADALAFGIPINRTQGSMLINMGAQSTVLSVIAESRILVSKVLQFGGNALNSAIVANVRRRNHFSISEKTARRLKVSLTDLSGQSLEARKVYGIDTNAGLPTGGIVASNTVTAAVEAELSKFIHDVRIFLKRIPPQIRKHIMEEGIYLCGGCSSIRQLPKYLNTHLDAAVNLSGNFDLHTITGIRELITHDALHHFAEVID